MDFEYAVVIANKDGSDLSICHVTNILSEALNRALVLNNQYREIYSHNKWPIDYVIKVQRRLVGQWEDVDV